MGLGTWFKRLFEQSPHIHNRQEVAATPSDLIDLIDRFIDGPMRYPLEWDDFISWEQANPNVEAVRIAIGRYEGWLASKDRSKINAYAYRVAEERNRLAAIIGRPPRDMPILDAVGKALIRPAMDPCKFGNHPSRPFATSARAAGASRSTRLGRAPGADSRLPPGI